VLLIQKLYCICTHLPLKSVSIVILFIVSFLSIILPVESVDHLKNLKHMNYFQNSSFLDILYKFLILSKITSTLLINTIC
jgi:hypothetical protein